MTFDCMFTKWHYGALIGISTQLIPLNDPDYTSTQCSSPHSLRCKTASLSEHSACYSILNSPLHELSENVRTVQVSVHLVK